MTEGEGGEMREGHEEEMPGVSDVIKNENITGMWKGEGSVERMKPELVEGSLLNMGFTRETKYKTSEVRRGIPLNVKGKRKRISTVKGYQPQH